MQMMMVAKIMDFFRLITICFALRVGKTMTVAVMLPWNSAEVTHHLGIVLAHVVLVVQVF